MSETALRGDEDFMRIALALAERGRTISFPNPAVGALLIRDDMGAAPVFIGRGWTRTGGRPHAEAVALEQAGDLARGATAYVTLEPCAHQSARGPDCTGLLIAAGVRRVVIAIRDPDERTSGRGIERLEQAGIEVTCGICADEARSALAGYIMRRTQGRPFVTLKLACSLDGQIALTNGESQWITGALARRHTHLQRARHDAILVGGGTYRSDQPRLDVRLPGLEQRSPQRVLLSRSEDAPKGWLRISRPEDIGKIADIHWLMVEGGAETASAFLRAGLVDQLLLYRAPVLLGKGRAALGDLGLERLADAHGRWQLRERRSLGPDLLERYDHIGG